MSSIITTEAVVLRSIKFRETSKIVTFYTRKFGTVGGIVKGARSPKSRFAGAVLEPMSYVSLVMYRKEGREIQTISECASVEPFRRITESLESIAAGMSVVELVTLAARNEEENPALFTLIVDALRAINGASGRPDLVVPWFEVHLASILGFAMSFDRCLRCGRDVRRRNVDGDSVFHLSRGGLLCGSCRGEPGFRMSAGPDTLDLLRELADTKDPRMLRSDARPAGVVRDVGDLLWTYLRFHVPEIRSLRTGKVFSSLLDTP